MSNQPAYVWALVLAGAIGIPALTVAALARGRKSVAAGFAIIWTAWVVTSAVLADHNVYAQLPETTRPWFGLAAGGVLVALLLGAVLPAVRATFARPTSLAWLTWPQVIRVVGVTFLIVMARGDLPAVFALPAGLGDIAVGIAAVPIARRLARGDRTGAVGFNLLGLLDLVVAVSIGFGAGLGPTRLLDVSPSTADVVLLPLALIPTTAVPLAAVLHIVSLRRLSVHRGRVETVAA
jgi:hypothetical protein